MDNEIGLFEHFTLLARFGGREDRASFWPYAALAFGLLTVCNMLFMVPTMMSASGMLDSGMPPHLPNFTVYFAVVGALGVLLYAAAVARRLRDSGRSPWWGLMPLPFGAVSMLGMAQIFRSPFNGIPPDATSLQLMMIGNALYTLTLIALIIMLTVRSAPRSSASKGAKPAPHYHEE